jgi:hypothetical protein
MSARLENASAARKPRRQPFWPWLLMPLVALLIFLALRNARQEHPGDRTAPGETTTATSPGPG